MARKPPKGKSIAEVNPELAKQWHPTKNGELDPYDFSYGSEKKVWWKCPKGNDHEWVKAVHRRNQGIGCPICSGHKVVKSNCIATLNPKLATQWHPSKNSDLTPFDISLGEKKVWWKCPKGDDHEWEASTYSRNKGRGCPICSGHKVVKSNCLATLNPKLAEEWHPANNGDLTPFDVVEHSTKKVWWKCAKGDDHVWKISVDNKTNYNGGNGCPICSGHKVVKSNCLATLNPKLAEEWHPTKNADLTPFDVVLCSHKKIWWKCPKGDDHEWRTTVAKRSGENNCPICSGRKVVKSNCLATLNPKLAEEWHTTKNGDLSPFDFAAFSHKKIWWKCGKGDDHEWESRIADRSKGQDCPVCSRKKVVLSNCLATTHPKLAKEWHFIKNSNITPFHVVAGSSKKIWWKCRKGDDHEWVANIGSRKKGIGCPICSGHKVVKSNCLATTHPELAIQWNYGKNNGLTPDDVAAGSAKKVWWECDKGKDHVYMASLVNKKNGRGCPICANTKVVDSNSLLNTHPYVAKYWHKSKNNQLTSSDVTSGSTKKVWWKCPEGEDHEWKSSVREKINIICPICVNRKVVNSNCLATTHPDLAKEWHISKNSELTPNDVVVGSSKNIWWKCEKGEDHVWRSTLDNRFRGNGCPYCTLTPQSKQELTITFELIQFFKDINPKGFKTRVKGKLWSIDIYIPQLILGIEFDGSYWHKDKRALDKLKTEQLEDEGFEIFRVREEPLKRIFDDDIISKQPFNGKQVANDILTQIMSRYSLNAKKTAKIVSYIAKKELQNDKGLDKYIDMILTEKAAKKK